jgi:hypothetical protein
MPDGFLAGYIGVNIRINAKQCNVNVEPNNTATENEVGSKLMQACMYQRNHIRG